jgi:hypothetical protein
MRGYRPDPKVQLYTSMHHFLGAGRPRESADLSGYLPPVTNQGATQSCVPHAILAAYHAGLKRAGIDTCVRDPLMLYRCTLVLDSHDPLLPMSDDGCMPYTCLRALVQFGVRPARGPQSVTEPPTIGDLIECDRHLVADQRAAHLTSYGVMIDPASIRRALDVGCVVTAALQSINPAWEGYTGGTLGLLGYRTDHYVVIYGYEGEEFLGRNSWGESWGTRGDFRIHSEAVAGFDDTIAHSVRSLSW